jgi:hypothetical protein
VAGEDGRCATRQGNASIAERSEAFERRVLYAGTAMRAVARANLLLALLTIVACGSKPLKSAAVACASDSECAAGLSCLPLGAFTDAGCTTAAKACSRTCTIDSDCAPLGSTYKCFADCSGSYACGATQ